MLIERARLIWWINLTVHLTLYYLFLDAPKSQCSSLSDGESFEGFGENYNQEGGIDLELAPHLNSTQIV